MRDVFGMKTLFMQLDQILVSGVLKGLLYEIETGYDKCWLIGLH